MTTQLRGIKEAAQLAMRRLKTWFEPPVDTDARPLEIREAIIDHVERHAEPGPGGRRALRHNHIAISLLATEKDDRTALDDALADVMQGIRTRLTEIRCRIPNGLQVEVEYIKKPRAGWAPGQRFSVEYSSRAVTKPSAPPRATLPLLRLTVIRGQAAHKNYVLTEPHVRIGRTTSPMDHMGRPRRNHVAFAEDGDGHSVTVGRAHASIRYDEGRREYRLFDDGSHNGTRVVRNGQTVEVVRSNPLGVTLFSGDEIQFGTAAVQVTIEEPK